MKLLFLPVILFFISVHHGHNQILCPAQDSIIAMYKDDADRLALRKTDRLNLPQEDSVEILQIMSDTFLNALLAVFNAIDIPERDTVISILDIHTRPIPLMRTVLVTADSSLTWMQQLQNGILPTGYQPLDSIIAKYELSIEEYDDNYNWFYWHAVTFKAPRNYNIPALANAFETLPDVYFSEPTHIIGDGPDINDDLFFIIGEDFGINLYYSYKWGDCLAGCTGSRTWWFKVYPDCGVEFVNVFGSPLPFTATSDEEMHQIILRPNPFHNEMLIEGNSDIFEYSITDLNGNIISRGNSYENKISNLEILHPGFYIVAITSDHKVYVRKMIKM